MTETSMQKLRTYFQDNRAQILEEFLDFLRLATVSTDPAYAAEMTKGSQWLASYLSQMGFSVEIWPTSGHPTLFAEHSSAGTDKPTVLFYNHYDVQPVDPLELWHSPPFSPRIEGETIYARGAQDNKGQCFYLFQALKALLQRDGCLPVNVKLCIEGEEECGSAGLAGILTDRRKRLRADALAIVDVGLPGPQQPAVTLGLRGLISMDITATGAKVDAHSGSHGGLLYNPIRALVELLAALYDDEGKVAVPGFYDEVREISSQDKARLTLQFDAQAYLHTFGVAPTGGEKHLHPLERNWLRPTLEINGICGGYTGAGVKTVIPAQAVAKLSCRLVPGQDPQITAHRVADYLISRAPAGIQLSVQVHAGRGAAVRSCPDSAPVRAFAQAYEEVFGCRCSFILEGASIPIATELAQASGAELVLYGMGLATDNIHAPNEHFSVDRIEKGLLVTARALELYASLW